MDEITYIQAVRQQRRDTVAAIEAVEQWSKANREPGNIVFTDGVDLYLRSQEMTTVEELFSLETEARTYLLQLQGKP